MSKTVFPVQVLCTPPGGLQFAGWARKLFHMRALRVKLWHHHKIRRELWPRLLAPPSLPVRIIRVPTYNLCFGRKLFGRNFFFCAVICQWAVIGPWMKCCRSAEAKERHASKMGRGFVGVTFYCLNMSSSLSLHHWYEDVLHTKLLLLTAKASKYKRCSSLLPCMIQLWLRPRAAHTPLWFASRWLLLLAIAEKTRRLILALMQRRLATFP